MNPTPEQQAYRDFLLDRSAERARGVTRTVTISDRPKPGRGPQGKVNWCASKKRWRCQINGKDCLFKTEAEAKAAIIAALPAREVYQLKFVPPPPKPVEQPDPEDDDRFIDERTGEYGSDEPGEGDCSPEEYQDSEADQLDRIYFDPL
jgi:hypothetical protein